MNCEVLTAFVYRNNEGDLRECSHTSVFEAKDHIDAIQSAVRLAKHLDSLIEDEKIGALKVYELYIGPISEKGDLKTRKGINFFEWKYDWPGTLDDWAHSKIEDHKRNL